MGLRICIGNSALVSMLGGWLPTLLHQAGVPFARRLLAVKDAVANVFGHRALVTSVIGFKVGIAGMGAIARPLVGARIVAVAFDLRASFPALLIPLATCLPQRD